MQTIINNKSKKIYKILDAATIDMGGFPVKQALPLADVRMLDPFLLLHHARNTFDNRQKAIHQGVGPHPHRGFSPVTFVVNGEVHHRDSMGNNQIASEGEVQWMNAGAGIIHSERPSQKIVDEGIEQEILQLWINTPAAQKMEPPTYQFLTKDQVPVISSGDGKIHFGLISGQMDEIQQSNIETDSDLLILWTQGEKAGNYTLEIPQKHNTMVYVIKGALAMNDRTIYSSQLAIFERGGSEIEIDIIEDAQFLIMSGQPINERIIQQGPFVMNSKTQILEAMRDYQMGKMGFLVEE